MCVTNAFLALSFPCPPLHDAAHVQFHVGHLVLFISQYVLLGNAAQRTTSATRAWPPSSSRARYSWCTINVISSSKMNSLRKSQIIMYIGEWIYKESITFFKDCKVAPFRRSDWPKTRDKVNATKDFFDWNYARSSVSPLHRSRHLIHKVFLILCGWNRAEPFDVSEVVWGTNVCGWKHIIDVFTGYLEYSTDLGNTNT